MNFRLAYEPRAHLPTVNQLGQRNGVGKWGLRSKTNVKLLKELVCLRCPKDAGAIFEALSRKPNPADD
jgi:hypothetical protein